MAYLMSISSSRQTQNTREERWYDPKEARPHACLAWRQQWRLRWSRKLGELYLRPNGLHGEVGDVEELKVWLQLRGIRRWCLGTVDFLVAAVGSPPVAALLGGEEQGGNGMAIEREGVRRRLDLHM
jgi:hypothetical protein